MIKRINDQINGGKAINTNDRIMCILNINIIILR